MNLGADTKPKIQYVIRNYSYWYHTEYIQRVISHVISHYPVLVWRQQGHRVGSVAVKLKTTAVILTTPVLV